MTLADGGDVSFQEYFVKLRHGVPVQRVRFDGAERRRADAGARRGADDRRRAS